MEGNEVQRIGSKDAAEVLKEKRFGGSGVQRLRRTQSKVQLVKFHKYFEISKNGIPNQPKTNFKQASGSTHLSN